MIVVAFATKNTPYEEELEGLRKSVESWPDLRLIAYTTKNTGCWVMNCAAKPVVCLKAFLELQEDFLYLDADARIVGPLDTEMLASKRHVSFVRRRDARYKGELLSGTLWIPYEEETRLLLNAWVQAQKTRPDEWDQKVLEQVASKFTTEELPSAYTKIFDANYGEDPPLILHMQASRRLRGMLQR